MVMPRAFSSGALSIESKLRNWIFGLFLASTLVMAAVRVVLPWSTWPMVPTLTCGLVRSNFSFAIFMSLLNLLRKSLGAPPIPACLLRSVSYCRKPAGRDACAPRGFSLFQGAVHCDLNDPCLLRCSLNFRNDLLAHALRRFLVAMEVHRR